MRVTAMTAAVVLACGVAACETTTSTERAMHERDMAPPAAATTPEAAPSMAYTDEQLRNFIRANAEVSAIANRHASALQGTPEQQAAARAQIQTEALPVLQRHDLDAQTYNAIANAARTDPTVQARLAELRASSPGG